MTDLVMIACARVSSTFLKFTSFLQCRVQGATLFTFSVVEVGAAQLAAKIKFKLTKCYKKITA